MFHSELASLLSEMLPVVEELDMFWPIAVKNPANLSLFVCFAFGFGFFFTPLYTLTLLGWH